MKLDNSALSNAFKGFDPNNLDLNTAGSWPIGVKVICYLLVFGLICFLGMKFYVTDKENAVRVEMAKEEDLKSQYRIKANQVASLDDLRKQMADVQEQFTDLLKQLPTAKEVPGLLEDITDIGRAAGLDIDVIALAAERKEKFYIELPINIQVVGTYHQMGQFVSGVAAIKRIVTLHDYSITETDNGLLSMSITAKTYRYDDE